MHSLSVSIRQTVRDFRLEYSEWEDEVRALFDDVDCLLAADATAAAEPGTAMAATVAEDVAGLRGLVEQQTEVLTALVNALTEQSASAVSASDQEEFAITQSEPEVDPFERLQQVVAAAASAN